MTSGDSEHSPYSQIADKLSFRIQGCLLNSQHVVKLEDSHSATDTTCKADILFVR